MPWRVLSFRLFQRQGGPSLDAAVFYSVLLLATEYFNKDFSKSLHINTLTGVEHVGVIVVHYYYLGQFVLIL